MRRLARLVRQASCAGIALVALLPAPAGAAHRAGWLHTKGTSIVDDRGRHVRLTGFNQGGMYAGESGNARDGCGARWQEPPAELASNLEKWGFNSVRLHISWSNLEPTPPTTGPGGRVVHHWNTDYLRALDRFVSEAGRHHVYVIPVMTQAAVSPAYKLYDGKTCEGSGMPSWLFPDAAQEVQWQGWCHFFGNRAPAGVPVRPIDGFASAWRQIARRYAHDPTVAAVDVLNEPGNAFYPCFKRMGIALRADYLDRFYARVGSAIREVDPRVMLIIEDSSYTEGAYGHFLSSTAGLRNVVYEWHNYSPDWAEVKMLLEQQQRFAQRIGAPLWLGEFAAFDGAQNALAPTTPAWREDLATMMGYLRAHDVSWSMQNYDGESSIVRPGTTDAKPELLSLLRLGVGRPTARAARLEIPAGDDAIGATPASAWPCFSIQGYTCSYDRGVRAHQAH